MEDKIYTMPAVALRGMTILPGMVAHFDISRERSIKAVETAMMGDQLIFLVTQKNANEENPQVSDLFSIGVVANIRQVIKLQNDIVRVLVEGSGVGSRLLGRCSGGIGRRRGSRRAAGAAAGGQQGGCAGRGQQHGNLFFHGFLLRLI